MRFLYVVPAFLIFLLMAVMSLLLIFEAMAHGAREGWRMAKPELKGALVTIWAIIRHGG